MITDNGTLKLITIFIAIIGMVLGMVVGGYTWTSSNFVSKGEMSYIRQSILDIRADVREIKIDIKQIALMR